MALPTGFSGSGSTSRAGDSAPIHESWKATGLKVGGLLFIGANAVGGLALNHFAGVNLILSFLALMPVTGTPGAILLFSGALKSRADQEKKQKSEIE